MVISRRLLNEGERVLLSIRTHVKALIVPALALIVVAALAGYLSSLPSGDRANVWRWIIWGIAAALVLVFSGVPFLRWLTTTYTFTNRRLITRTGILTRRGHDIPLNRISDISYEKDLVDRVFGCGTLIVSDASELGQVELSDIPRVEEAQLAISDELFHGGAGPGAAPSSGHRSDEGA